MAIGWVESAIETKNAQPSCFLFSHLPIAWSFLESTIVKMVKHFVQ